jgi:exonuclease III
VGQTLRSKARDGVPELNPYFRSQQSERVNIPHVTPAVKQRKKTRLLRLGTWNVRTLLDKDGSDRPERRTALVAKELKRYGIDIAALSETRLAGQGKLREASSGYTFYWSGTSQESRREHGVGFAVSDHINARIMDEPDCINSRMMIIRIRLSRARSATFISVYAPTMSHSDEEKDNFYDQLLDVIKSTPPSDYLFLLGDFNARVGKDAETWKKILGPFGIGSMNDNGGRLLTMCAALELSITNTWFNLGRTPVATWTHPRSRHGHLIDYVIVRQRDHSDVLITKVMRGADCNTDHALVRTKVRVALGKLPRRGPRGKSVNFDIKNLKNQKIVSKFREALTQKLMDNQVPTTPESQWCRIKHIFKPLR